MTELRISPVAYQSHVTITNTEFLGNSLVFRIPEFVKRNDGRSLCPGMVEWEVVEPEQHLRYRWAEEDAVKAEYGTDFSGDVHAGDGQVSFEVTMTNLGTETQRFGPSLFCLQAGAVTVFHDFKGKRTFVRKDGRWVSVHEMQAAVFEEHRMCGYDVGREVDHNLMAKVASDGAWVLGLALAGGKHVSCNHQLWPSCIHANPDWSHVGPGESDTVRGNVYYFEGDLDALYERFREDFR